MIIDGKILEGILDPNSSILRKQGEVFYFVEPAKDIAPDQKEDVQNKKKWTILRSLCYRFFVSEMESLPPGLMVLDVGMGQAQFKELYSDMVVVGADYYPYPDVRVVTDFTKSLPFKDASFDVIIASNVMEHLPNPEEVVREYYRVLKKGGRVIVAVPFLVGVHQAPYDFYRYTHFMLERMLRGAGFSEQKVEILGTGFDAYTQTQRKFFSLMTDSKNEYSNFFGKLTIWLLAKLAWVLQSALNILLRPLLKRVGVTMKLPLGYGFTAVK